MQPSDKPKFLAVLNGLAAVKPGAKLTLEALDLYWSALRDWSIEDFTQAANHLARTSEFMPNPYHFEQLRKAGRPTSGEAWAKVLDYVRDDYSHHTPGSLDPMTDRAVRAIGGYRAVAMSEHSQTPFLERRFAEHYEAISDAEDVREAVPGLGYEPRKKLNGPRGFQHLAYLDHDDDEAGSIQ